MDRAELVRLLPDARIGTVAAACFAPHDGQVEPPLVLAACRAELEAAGVRFVTGRARVHLDDDGVRVEAAGEVLRPQTCVLAAGPRPPRWPPRSASRSRPWPARACWSRPGRWLR